MGALQQVAKRSHFLVDAVFGRFYNDNTIVLIRRIDADIPEAPVLREQAELIVARMGCNIRIVCAADPHIPSIYRGMSKGRKE